MAKLVPAIRPVRRAERPHGLRCSRARWAQPTRSTAVDDRVYKRA